MELSDKEVKKVAGLYMRVSTEDQARETRAKNTIRGLL